MNIKVYSLPNCPRCVVLRVKLNNKGYKYEEIMDEEILLQKGFTFLPMVEIDEKIYTFSETIKLLETLEANNEY